MVFIEMRIKVIPDYMFAKAGIQEMTSHSLARPSPEYLMLSWLILISLILIPIRFVVDETKF